MIEPIPGASIIGEVPVFGEFTTKDEPACYLWEHWPRIQEELLRSDYRPKPVREVSIPTPGGWTRRLGIPTVLDRFIRQAIL